MNIRHNTSSKTLSRYLCTIFYIRYSQIFLSVEPSATTETETDSTDDAGNLDVGVDVNEAGGNPGNDGQNDPDDTDEICEDRPQSKDMCRKAKRKGCINRDLLVKHCRKTCGMCGKIPILKTIHNCKVLFSIFNYFHALTFFPLDFRKL